MSRGRDGAARHLRLHPAAAGRNGNSLAGLRGRTAGKNDRGLPDRRLSPGWSGPRALRLSSAGENPVFSCGADMDRPCPSGKKTTFPSGPPEPVLTCAATTAMPPCCWARLRILKAHENQLTANRKALCSSPGRKTGAGARLMVEAGGSGTSPGPQAAFALHVQSVEETGTACCAFGVNSASLDTFILKIRGRGGHSSQPQLCVDPLMILNQVYGAVNLLAAREADPASMVTLTCGVAKGGTRCQHYSGRSGASHRSADPGIRRRQPI